MDHERLLGMENTGASCKTGFSDDIANLSIIILEAKTRSGFISCDLIYMQLHCFCGCVQRGL